MVTIQKEVYIDAPIERVYEFLTTPEHLPEIWPSLVEVRKVKRHPDGQHNFDWTYKMGGVRFKGHAETTSVSKNRAVTVRNEKGIPSTFHWSYQQQNGGTHVSVEINYTVPGKVLGKLAEPLVKKLNESETETLLHNLKLRMEEGAEKVA